MMDFAATYIQAFARGMITRKQMQKTATSEPIGSSPSLKVNEVEAQQPHHGGLESSAESLPVVSKRSSLTSVFDTIPYEETDKIENEDSGADYTVLYY